MGPVIQQFFSEGGPFMYVTALFLACAVAVIAERWITLAIRFRLNVPLVEQIDKLVASGNVNRAAELCRAAPPHAPLPKVLRAVLVRASQGPAAVSKAREQALAENATPFEVRISWLVSLAQAAALFGAIGTGVGVIDTVRSLAGLAPEKRQAAISAGIREALNNAALGVGVAVVCVLANRLLRAYARTRLREVEAQALKLESALARRNPQN